MKRINSFGFKEGDPLNGRFEMVEFLGAGWEGEVYLVKEKETGIARTAKLFFPQRNRKGKNSKFYARKLHKLKNCEIIIQYYGHETIYIDGEPIVFLISEFIEGELLSSFVSSQPGKRLHYFAALHLLHSLASGMADIHALGEYHGDLHTDNIIVERSGLDFDLKVIDLHHLGSASAEHVKIDVVDMINVFYEILGGQKNYSRLPNPIKDICCGLKKSLILKKFKTAGQLRNYIENLEWE